MNINENLSTIAYKDLNVHINSIREEDFLDRDIIINTINSLRRDSRKNIQGLALKLENKLNKHINEVNRTKSLYEFDKNFGIYEYIAGVDEVGRGPLAGPIVAAAVILDIQNLSEEKMILGLNDSKKISPEKREILFDIITEKSLYYKITLLDNNVIDNDGIGVCNHKVFLTACNELPVKPDLVLSDGYLIKGYCGLNKAVIKGDTKSANIAAASIIAKVYRDELMKKYSALYPQYGFERNAGYGTAEHIEAIKKYGITPIHRKSFLRALIP